jgi:hypothetical protein
MRVYDEVERAQSRLPGAGRLVEVTFRNLQTDLARGSKGV